MNLFSKLASTLVAVAGLCAGQTVPGTSAVPVSASAASTITAASPTPPAPAPDLTFKPSPQDEPAPPPPAVPQSATPAVPQAATPGTNPPAPQSTSTPTPTPSAGGSAASATTPANKSATDAATVPVVADMPLYVLGANDVIAVTVFGEGNVSGTYTIGPDGRVSMPLIHDFTAVGLTIRQLQTLVTQKLGDFIIDPVVNVQLLRNNSKKYTLIGGVLKSGPYPLLQETTILDALAASGGFKDFANQKKIILRRGTKEYHFNYKDAIKGKHLDQNITIQDGDIIVVPE